MSYVVDTPLRLARQARALCLCPVKSSDHRLMIRHTIQGAIIDTFDLIKRTSYILRCVVRMNFHVVQPCVTPATHSYSRYALKPGHPKFIRHPLRAGKSGFRSVGPVVPSSAIASWLPVQNFVV